MTPTPDNAPAKPSALPLVALILGVIGFCFPPLFLVAIILAIVSLAKANEPGFSQRKAMAIITIVLGVVYVPMMGILAAIAIPNFIKYQARSKQSECKMYLKVAYAAQQSFHAENGRWGDTAEEIGFQPEPKRRYLYLIGPDSAVAPDHPEATSAEALEQGLPPRLRSELGAQDKLLTMACAGNVDKDPFIDVWSIASQERVIDGQTVPPGTPYNERDDTRD